MVKYGHLLLRSKERLGKIPYSSRIGGFSVDYKRENLFFSFLNASSSLKVLKDGRVEVEWELANLDQDLYSESWKDLELSPADLTAEFLTSLPLIDLYSGIFTTEEAEKKNLSIEAKIISFSLREEKEDKHFDFKITEDNAEL